MACSMSVVASAISAAQSPPRDTINDASARVDYWIRPNVGASAFVQYEQWTFPFLAPGLQKNYDGFAANYLLAGNPQALTRGSGEVAEPILSSQNL